MAADASDYPTSADSIPRTSPSDNLTGHSDLHDKMADAIEEIQGFVGVSGDTTAGTVVKRITDLEGKDITVTFGTGSDLSGSFTITNLGSVTNTSVAVRDDSHSHVISNVDSLQDALDAKLNSSAYTANDVLNKIKSVDGSTSGLDADLLDGNEASAFALAHTHPYASSSHDHNTVYADINHGHTNMLTGKRGNGSYYVEGNGYATITHGLGSTPVAAFVQTRAQITTGGGGGETVISLPITSVTSTTVTFRAYEADAGNNNNSGYVSTIYDTTPGDTFVNVSWLVIA